MVAYGRVVEEIEIVGAISSPTTSSALDRLFLQTHYSESASIIFAVVLGERWLLSKRTRELFQRLGLSHLLVISGFHIAAVFGVVAFIVSTVARRSAWLLHYCSSTQVSTVSGMVAVASYALVVEPGLPVLRAVFVLCFCGWGAIIARRASPARTLLCAILVVLLICPGALFEVGPQLTFAAVLGLLCAVHLLDRWRGGRSGKNRALELLLKSAVLSSFAWIFTLPLVAYHFRIFVPLTALINVLIVPLFSLVFLFLGAILVAAAKLEIAGVEVLGDVLLETAAQLLAMLVFLDSLLTRFGIGAQHLSVNQAVIVSGSAAVLTLVILFALVRGGTCRRSLT